MCRRRRDSSVQTGDAELFLDSVAWKERPLKFRHTEAVRGGQVGRWLTRVQQPGAESVKHFAPREQACATSPHRHMTWCRFGNSATSWLHGSQTIRALILRTVVSWIARRIFLASYSSARVHLRVHSLL